MQGAVGTVYMSLGRMRDAQHKMQDSADPWNVMILAELPDDLQSDASVEHVPLGRKTEMPGAP